MNPNFLRFTKPMPSSGSGYRPTASTSAQEVSSSNQPHPPRHPYPSSSAAPAPGVGRDTIEHSFIQSLGRMTISTQPYVIQPINVVLFGEPGVGKSAVVNLIARKNVARVSPGVKSCPLQSTPYNTSIDDINLCVFETAGFEQPEIRGDSYSSALEKAYDFVNKLSAAGGIHLVLFCICANRLTATTKSNYQLLTEVIFQTKVPIALVVTGLEGEATMEDWWMKNKTIIDHYGLNNDGHACITTMTNGTPRQNYNYTESHRKIRELLTSLSLKMPASLPQPHDWFVRLGIGMQQFVEEHRMLTNTDVLNTLGRLKLDPRVVQGFLGMMERGDARQNSRDGAGRPQGAPPMNVKHRNSEGEVDTPKVNVMPVLQDWDAGKRSNELPSGSTAAPWKQHNELPGTATVKMGMPQSQYRYPNAVSQQDKSWQWEDGTRRAETIAGKATAEFRQANPPYIRGEMGVSMEDIRSNFAHDLTGHVTRSDRYPFASGTYGDIYRGKLRTSGKSTNVAIKVYKMYAQRDESLHERTKRFYRELRVWLNLQHPNVLPLFGTVRDPSMHPDMPAMVCPWVDNGSLSKYLERNELTVTERLSLVNDVAHGLQYLHSQRVVHGDLSGSNVLVYASGRACIADFGLSTSLTAISGRTPATSRQDKGTVRWMAPELLGVDDSHTIPTTRSDVYSFGSVMLQILTGNVPYHRHSRDEQVIYAILKGTRPERSDHKVVTEGRWRFIERCWSLNRPSSDEIVGFTRREFDESLTPRYF